MSNSPLNDLVVVDLSRVLAGPYSTMILADLGARVIKVEVPQTGDDARQFGPFINNRSVYFSSLNRGKQSIALNLKNPEDKETFNELVKSADVLVENFRPGTMKKLGYGWEDLKNINPMLIYAAVSGFGQTGPYADRPAYDMVVQAMGGIMSITGKEGDATPLRVGTAIGDITAGLFATIGILAALNDRERKGEGSMIDIGMLDCQLAILENAVGRYLSNGEIPGPLGARHPSITPFEAFQTLDDPIIIAAGNNVLFNKLCEALKRKELINEAKFLSNDLRTQNHRRLKMELEKTLIHQSAEHWLSLLIQAGIPCGPINNVEQIINDEHIRQRNMVIKSKLADDSELRMAGNPIKISGYEDHSTRAGAPDLDAHRDEILKELNK